MKKHQKHTKLIKPERGFYAMNEISLMGSNCDRINNLACRIAEEIGDDFKICYVDANHGANELENGGKGIGVEVIDQISHHQYNVHFEESTYLKNAMFDSTHLTLINGNHEKGENQIVIMDSKKESSLRKRAGALTNVIALVGVDDKVIPDYIRELIPNHGDLPVFLLNEKGVSNFISSFVENKKPPIMGLILGGGQSVRMGMDKINISYHGMPQHEYLKNIMSKLCDDVYVSCRSDQSSFYDNALEDTFVGLGAYGGLLSAFRDNPKVAWFVVACDIPLLDETTLQTLFKRRKQSKVATCFYNSTTAFPEPLITIWEPKAYPILLHYLSQGYSCPRKVLINNEVEIVKLEDEMVLKNVNTSEEKDMVLKNITEAQTKIQ